MEIGIVCPLVSEGNQYWRKQSEGERQSVVPDVAQGGSKKCISQATSETELFLTPKHRPAAMQSSAESRVMFFHQSGIPCSF